MSIAQSEIWSQLVQSGLCDDASCRRYAEAFDKNHHGSPPTDSAALLQFLVRAKAVTAFQASKLARGELDSLKIGSYAITSDQPVRPLTHWIPVARIHEPHAGQASEREGKHETGFLLRVPLENLDENRRAWLAIHSEIHCPSLQPVELSGGAQATGTDHTSTDHIVLIYSRLPDGVPLWRVLEAKPKLSLRKTVRMGLDLAAALQSMHETQVADQPLCHGAVGADHVWITPKGHAVLLRDPSSSARTPHGDLSTSWIERIESPVRYAAPELAAPDAVPNRQSDVYSLACLLFSVLVGRPAFEGSDDQALIAAHQTHLPPELAEAVDRGADGHPVLRVLAYGMAKDPAARFASASAFADALGRAGELAAGQKPSESAIEQPNVVDRSADPTSSVRVSNQDTTPPPAWPPSPAPSSGPAAAPTSDAQTPRPRKRRSRKSKRWPILVGTMVIPMLMLGLAIVLRGAAPIRHRPRDVPQPERLRNVPKVADSRRNVTSNSEIETKRINGFEIVDSDRLLWVPPYDADTSPPSLELLPPGPAAIVSVSIAKWANDPDAKSLITTLSPELNALLATAADRAGVPTKQISRCTVALFPGRGGWPETAMAIELSEPISIDQLSERWNAGEARAGDAVVYVGDEPAADAYFIGGGDNGKLAQGQSVQRFAVGSLDRIREVAETGGAAIPLARNLQSLWDRTNQGSDFVALVTPNFLFADGRELINRSVPEFRDSLKRWLIPSVSAVSLSVSVNESLLYAELREMPSGGATAATLLKSLREKIDAWPAWAESFNVNSNVDASWKLLAIRLPQMLRFAGQQTRSTILGETVVASAYLPTEAGSQVALGTLLAMNTPAGNGNAMAAVTEPTSLTVDEMLDRPMTISFLQQSLQFAIQDVVDQFAESLPPGSTMPAVRIVGSDLEKNGITQNQQIRGFERTNQSLRSVLTDLVLGANPDKTATGPSDLKQSLVWVVHPKGMSPADTEILITTRDAAAGQYELPAEFRTE